MNLQSIISREIDPIDSAVVTVGHLTSGSQYNIISGEAFFEGTVRAFSEETAEKIEASLRRIVDMTAKTYGASAEVEFGKSLHPVVVNDEADKTALCCRQRPFWRSAAVPCAADDARRGLFILSGEGTGRFHVCRRRQS